MGEFNVNGFLSGLQASQEGRLLDLVQNKVSFFKQKMIEEGTKPTSVIMSAALRDRLVYDVWCVISVDGVSKPIVYLGLKIVINENFGEWEVEVI